MAGYSALDSLDEVRIGEYLMCCRGPWVHGTDARGRTVSRHDRTFEGTIVRIIAINPPIMLVTVYPMPCGDPNHDHTPYPALLRWDFMGWSRVNRRYAREYMRAANHKPPVRLLPQRAGVVSHEEFDQMLEDIYKKGGNYEGPIPGFPPPEDDDDNLAPTHE